MQSSQYICISRRDLSYSEIKERFSQDDNFVWKAKQTELLFLRWTRPESFPATIKRIKFCATINIIDVTSIVIIDVISL